MLMPAALMAQQRPDTANTVTINILHAYDWIGVQTDSGNVARLIGDVQLQQGANLMYCDSAYLGLETNNMEAFGNVRIIQPGGTEVQSDYLRYTGNNRMAYLRGNVVLTDIQNTLWTEELTYDLKTRVGHYFQQGTLQSEGTVVESRQGMYNVRTKDARFTGDVSVQDPQYQVGSDDLGYNTQSRVVTFYGPSIVTNDKSVLRTSSGTYDSRNEIARFRSRSSILSGAQYIEADTLYYNRISGLGNAGGNVVALDTGLKSTLYSGYASYNERSGRMLASLKPVMKKMNGNDSLFIRADTFITAYVPRPADTARKADTISLKGSRKKIPAPIADTVAATDTVRLRYFIGFHNVRIFSDSMQGRCDSIAYSQADSLMRMIYEPVVWSRQSQITGDTILLYADSSSVRRLFIPNNALVVSRSGPQKAQMYDQVQGKTLTGHFEENALREVIVWPAAESIYFPTDKTGAYLGVNQAQGERMRILFRDGQMRRIIYEQDVRQTMTPLQQVNISTTRLSRFQWLEEKRPQSLAELFQ